MMMEAMEYFESYNEFGEARALMELREDAIKEIKCVLENMSEYRLYDILHEINNDFYRMEDLDDVYSNLSVREIIDELSDWVDTDYEYFESYTETCGDDPWYVSGLDVDEVCNGILDGEYEGCFYDRELDDVVEEYNEKKAAIIAKFRYYDNAKALFEMAMKNDPDETIALLWNMNN